MLIKICALSYVKRLNAQNVFLQIGRYLSYQSEPIVISKDILNNQSKIVDAASGARVSFLCADGKILEDTGDTKTMFDCFKKGQQLSGDNEFLGWKPRSDEPYKWMTYNEVDSRSKAFGDGLIHLGVVPSNETRIGIHSENRPEYMITDLGAMRHSICLVPLYNSIEIDNMKFILEQATIKTMVVDNDLKLNNILKWRKSFPLLERIIMYNKVKTQKRRAAESLGVHLHHIGEVEALGQQNPVKCKPAKPEDLYLVCYTSGTTGTPKGVMITHRGMCTAVHANLEHGRRCGVEFAPCQDTMLSYLPLAHSYERLLQGVVLLFGGRIGYFQGDTKKIQQDCQDLKPTILPGVPRLLNRIHDKVLLEAHSTPIKKSLFNMALARKKRDIEKGIVRNDTFWDWLVFNTVQSMLGGNIRYMTSGSAPLSPTVLTNLRCILGCYLVEAYGVTETCAAGCIAIPTCAAAGIVGPPTPNVMIKLVDVPEMNYFTKNNQGEIYMKGPSIFEGYLNNEVKTKEALTEDKWFITGDIGEWTENGSLKIIDRRKHLFKLSQGEFIAPEKIENILLLSPYLSQAFVYGDGMKNCLVAVCVVDKDTLSSLAKDMRLTAATSEEYCMSEEIQTRMVDELTQLGTLNGLSPLEQVKRVYLTTEEFSVDNGLMTPTFKLKRTIITNRFLQEIEEMYKIIQEKKNQRKQDELSKGKGKDQYF